MAWGRYGEPRTISRYANSNGFKPLEQGVFEMTLVYILKVCNFDGYGPSTDPTSETPPGARSARLHGRCRVRSEEHTSELQSLMRISYAVFCLKKKKLKNK